MKHNKTGYIQQCLFGEPVDKNIKEDCAQPLVSKQINNDIELTREFYSLKKGGNKFNIAFVDVPSETNNNDNDGFEIGNNVIISTINKLEGE